MNPREKGLRVNQQIRAPQVRLIDEEGKMVGVMSSFEALRVAEERGLDLIEIAPEAKPPTCKIMDYGKYKYEQKKKAQEARKNQTTIVIKEIQLRPRTEQHDIDVKLKAARRFFEEGAKTKFNMRFRGRELAHQELGMELILKIIEQLKDCSIVETSPKREGKQIFCLLAPEPGWLKEVQKKRKAEDEARAKRGEAPVKRASIDEVDTGSMDDDDGDDE